MKYKTSSNFKTMFVLAWLLFLVGIVTEREVAIGISVVIIVLLSVSVEILEAIHEKAK